MLVAYFVVIFAIGWYFSRKERTTSNYFLAGRDVAWWAVGASLFSSNIGSEHFIGLAGSGASSGLAAGHFEWEAAVIVLLLGWLFVPFYLRSGVFTMPEFLERRYNSACRTYLATISLIAYVFTKIAVAIFAGAIVLKAVLGWGMWQSSLALVVAPRRVAGIVTCAPGTGWPADVTVPVTSAVDCARSAGGATSRASAMQSEPGGKSRRNAADRPEASGVE